MKKTIVLAAFAAMALTACNKEEISGQQDENLVYREFTAVIENGASTKVSFGDPNTESGKIPAYFENGDKIALTDGTTVYEATVTKAEGQANTIGGDMPEDFTPTAAYYPYDAYTYNEEESRYEFTVPGRQYADRIPVLLQSTSIEGDYITFSAAEAGSSVVHYSLTGDILLTEVRLHVTNNASLINNNPQYTITYSSQYG